MRIFGIDCLLRRALRMLPTLIFGAVLLILADGGCNVVLALAAGPYSGTTSSVFPGTSKPGFPTSNNGCFPNIVSNATSGDPAKRLGAYYEYRSKFASEQSYNARFFNSLVGQASVYLPGSTIPAVHLTQFYSYTTLSKGRQCHGGDIDVLSRYDGIDYFQNYDIDLSPAVPQPQVFYFLYEDSGPRGFNIFYSCGLMSYSTGICQTPQVFVNSRIPQNKLSPEEQRAMDDVIDQVLKPYCMNNRDLQRISRRTDLESCPHQPLQAFLNLVEGYRAGLPQRKTAPEPV